MDIVITSFVGAALQPGLAGEFRPRGWLVEPRRSHVRDRPRLHRSGLLRALARTSRPTGWRLGLALGIAIAGEDRSDGVATRLGISLDVGSNCLGLLEQVGIALGLRDPVLDGQANLLRCAG